MLAIGLVPALSLVAGAGAAASPAVGADARLCVLGQLRLRLPLASSLTNGGFLRVLLLPETEGSTDLHFYFTSSKGLRGEL